MSLRFFRTVALAALAIGAARANAQTTVDLPAAADTSIFSAYPDNDFGASTLETGANGIGEPGRALIRFDLSSIPANAIITSAQITMMVVRVPPGDGNAGPVDSDFGLYPMLVPWQEGTGGGSPGAPAQPGDTTWNERGAGGVAAWGTPGGQIGVDFASTPSTSTSIGTQIGTYEWGSTPQFVSDLQSWLEDPATNFGYMMISDGENTAGTARRLASLESPGGSDPPPTLSVTYTTAPEPSAGLFLAMGGMAMCRRARRRKSAVDFISK